jgi:hypothetical protein
MRSLTQDELREVAGGCGHCHRDNGWGNGDDDAPGGSLPHNRAENNVRDGAAHPVWGTLAAPYSYVCGGNPASD